MRWALLFLAIVLMIDGPVIGVVLGSTLSGVLCFLAGVILAHICVLWPKWQQVSCSQPLKGWELGAGEDVTYPDKPTPVEQVTIAHDVLALGFLALGGPGSGKSESVAIGYLHYLSQQSQPEDATDPIGFSFFCGKGQKDVYQKAVASGTEFDFFFSSELPHSDSVNLMEGETHSVVDRLSGLLIGHTQTTSFYADEQRAVLSTVVPLLKSLDVPVNLRDLYTVLTVEQAAVEVMRRVRAQDKVESHIPALADAFFSQSEEKRLGLIRGLLNRLSEFVLGPCAPRLNAYQPTISIARSVKEGKRIYWHFPLSETAKAIATAITDMLQSVAMQRQQTGGELPLYPLIYDDWGDFFYDRFGPMAARCRSVNMPLSFMFQSVAQLDKVSPTFRDELDDTVATKIVLRLMGDQTAQYVVKKFGQYPSLELSQHGVDDGDVGRAHNTQWRDRLNADQMKDMDVGEAYINTLERRAGNSDNRFFKARFPLIPTPGWQFKDWPTKASLEAGIGLNLWSQFMSPEVKRQQTRAQVARFIEAQS